MLKRIWLSFFLVSILPALGWGQVVLRWPIQPGVDTRADVERTLGQPTRTLSENFSSYNPPAGYRSYLVEYRAGSDLVDRVEMALATPVARGELIQELRLPDRAELVGVTSEGKALEFFGSPAF